MTDIHDYPNVTIDVARVPDADAVLKLCFLAYQSEAQLYGDWSIPPLRETHADVLRSLDEGIVLVARIGEEVVGSVRGRRNAAGVEVGRLAVHPRVQHRGIGSRLLRSIEKAFDGTARFELFTGDRSEANLRLYRAHGYREIRRDAVSPKLTMIVLEKHA
jgi:ribosomal protein S18 acetylase RimI-like enzyme